MSVAFSGTVPGPEAQPFTLKSTPKPSQKSSLSPQSATSGWQRYWGSFGGRVSYPTAVPPLYPFNRGAREDGSPITQKRKTTLEWRLHHGNGVRWGHLGPTREVADYEFSDGTPMSMSSNRYALKHFQDKQIEMLIRAAAVVEELAETNGLPRIPGVKEQRDWDPEIPLFLSDVDEHGAVPVISTRNPKGQSPLSIRMHYAEELAQKNPYINGSKNSGKTIIKDAAKEGDSLEPLTLFASYDPAEMFEERLTPKDKRRPHWNTRRWNISKNFVATKAPKSKNTIADK